MVWSKGDELFMECLSRARLSRARLGFSGGTCEVEMMTSLVSSWFLHRNREDTGEERATSRSDEDVLPQRSSTLLLVAWKDVDLL